MSSAKNGREGAKGRDIDRGVFVSRCCRGANYEYCTCLY